MRTKTLVPDGIPLLMGVVNVTPDSFSGGGYGITGSGLNYQLFISPCALGLESQGERFDDRQNVAPVLADLSMNGANRS